MKITLMFAKPTTGGSAQLALQWSRLLRDAGATVQVLSLIDRPRRMRAGSVVELESEIGPIPSMGHRSRRDGPRTVWRIRRAIRPFEPDVIHVLDAAPEVYARLGTVGLGIPIVGTFVGRVARRRPGARSRLVHRLGLGARGIGADRWTALGRAVADFAVECGYDRELVEVVHPGFAPPVAPGTDSWISEQRREHPDRTFVIGVGRLEAVKRFELAIEAIALTPDDVHLVLVGEGAEHGMLERRSTTLGVADRVHFLGNQPTAIQLIADADVYVGPSESEGLVGYATLEAAALGTPIVVSDIPAVTQVLGDDCVRLVDPTDVRRFATCVLEAATATDDPRPARAREAVRAAFEPSNIQASLLAAYGDATGKPRTSLADP
jgi:glycosyltransferase involved in cell wall biosynthesis